MRIKNMHDYDKRIPFEKLKINSSFVFELDDNAINFKVSDYNFITIENNKVTIESIGILDFEEKTETYKVEVDITIK